MSKEGCGTNPFIVISGPGCDCAATSAPVLPRMDQDVVIGSVPTSRGLVSRVATTLRRRDHWGTIKARFGVGRMDYAVDPGLYAIGQPDESSPVFVSANYKMSVDALRSSLAGRSGWILVLDTDGINVWCAAGKGTFGTDELARRIELTGLKDVVSHRRLILPQLGAPGVSAHEVRKQSGFAVHYGPVNAQDLPAYLDAGLRATPEMRRKSFTLKERAVLIPVELVEALKPTLWIAPALFLLGGLGGRGGFWSGALTDGLFAVLAFLGALVAGAVLNPVLLPWLPGRAFSTKGFVIGALAAIGILSLRGVDWHTLRGVLEAASWLLIIPAVAAYLAMNYTGCATYTSLSGVRSEMRWALPLEIGLAGCGLLTWVATLMIL